MKKNEISGYPSHLLAGIILVVILVLLIMISSKLPGISTTIYKEFQVFHLIVLIFAIAIIGILFNIRPPAQILMGYLLSNKGKKNSRTAEPLGKSIINLAYAVLMYFVALFLVRRAVELFSTYSWILTVLTLAFVVILLILLFFLYRGLRIYLGTSGKVASGEFIPVQEENPYTIICPDCGNENPLGSKFCINCGTDISQIHVEETAKQEQVSYLICSKCGNKNQLGSKFCIKCGALLEVSEEKKEEAKEKKGKD